MRRAALSLALAVSAATSTLAQVSSQPSASAPAAGTKGGHTFQPRADAMAVAAAASGLAADKQELLQEINRLRARGATCGGARKDPAPPMQWSSLLMRAAERHVRDMAARGTIDHAGSDGTDVAARVEATGYRWKSVGENVAAGRATASATLAQWMASPGHCSNLMNPSYVDVAVAGAHRPGTRYGHYWVMVLARR